MAATGAVDQSTLKACLQADQSTRSRFATAINFNSPANIGRRGSVGAGTILTTASTAASISIHLLKPKTIWRSGMRKAVKVWKRRTEKKRPSAKNSSSVSRTPSRLSARQIRRSQSIRVQSQRRSSLSGRSAETGPQTIKGMTLILANPIHEDIEEGPVCEATRIVRFSHPLAGVLMSALPTPAPTFSFAVSRTDPARSSNSFETQDLQTPRTGDFRGSVNPSNVHAQRSEMTREQSNRRLDGLLPSRQVRGSSGPATQSNEYSVPARTQGHQPTIVTPRLPYVPAQPPFRGDSLRGDLNRCSGVEKGPEHAWAKLHQSDSPDIDEAGFEQFVRGHAGRQRSKGNKTRPSASRRSQFQSYQPGRPARASQQPFVAERPLPTPPMPMTPPPPVPASSQPRPLRYQSYHPDRAREPAMSAPPFVPTAPMPPTPSTPAPLRDQDKGKPPAGPDYRQAINNSSAGPSTAIQENHKRQSQAYDYADFDKVDHIAPPPKPHSIKRKALPSQTKTLRKSRLHAHLPPVPELDTPLAATPPSHHPDSLHPVTSPLAQRIPARAVSTAPTATLVPTAAPADMLIGGMMQAVMQLTSEVQSLRSANERLESANEALASVVRELGERVGAVEEVGGG